VRQRAFTTKFRAPSTDIAGGLQCSNENDCTAPPAVVVTTPEALAALVRDAVSEALNEARQNLGPLLLDRTNAARALGVGTTSIDRFRKAGMPCVWVGDAPRFIVDECLAWLREHRRGQPELE
jgi:hypothetical protein